MHRLLTDRQLREKLGGCSSMTLWRMRRDGKLPKPRKLGQKNVTPEDEADAAIAVLIGIE
jgi:predicted DNA-binding transcriptional regulator AlpA